MVIGSTNFPEALDKAVTRAGRFDKKIHIPEPNFDSRVKMLSFYLGKLKLVNKVDLQRMAMITGGFTGADIKNLVNTAAISAVSAQRYQMLQEDMDKAFERMQMGLRKSKSISDPEDLIRTAYHESGHAICGSLTEGAMKLNKVTILPAGSALGSPNQIHRFSAGSARSLPDAQESACHTRHYARRTSG